MSTERPTASAITNTRADRVRTIAALGGRSVRLRRRQFLVEGPQAVREALVRDRRLRDASRAGIVTEVYASDECLTRMPELADLCRGARLRFAEDPVLAAMADTISPQGIIAVCNFIDTSLELVLAARPTLVAVLARVQDPGNAGTVLRAADAAGADAIVVSAGSVDIYNPKAVRSTAGSLFHLPVVVGAGLSELTAQLHGAGVQILAADGHGDLDLDELSDRSAATRLDAAAGTARMAAGADPSRAAREADLAAPSAWLFGNEAQGLGDEILAMADHRVAVPVYGQAESLNVGTAATVCLYASARAQRR